VSQPEKEHSMKAYKIEVLVVDHDGLGADGIRETLENARYPNHCISPQVMAVTAADIGEWDDAHPLNSMTKARDYYVRLFSGNTA
jgi:hypothetical protein